MSKKPPRRTAQRIQEVALDLCNRFGVTNVSTTQIAAELRISAGNLYYHYPSKDELITSLVDRHELALRDLLAGSDLVRDRAGAMSFFRAVLEQVWHDRFIYRDLNHLLTNHRHVETRMRAVLNAQRAALREVLQGLRRAGVIRLADERDLDALGVSLAQVLLYWLSYEYANTPRQAFEPGNAEAAIERGLEQVMWLLDGHAYARPSPPRESLAATGLESGRGGENGHLSSPAPAFRT